MCKAKEEKEGFYSSCGSDPAGYRTTNPKKKWTVSAKSLAARSVAKRDQERDDVREL